MEEFRTETIFADLDTHLPHSRVGPVEALYATLLPNMPKMVVGAALIASPACMASSMQVSMNTLSMYVCMYVVVHIVGMYA